MGLENPNFLERGRYWCWAMSSSLLLLLLLLLTSPPIAYYRHRHRKTAMEVLAVAWDPL